MDVIEDLDNALTHLYDNSNDEVRKFITETKELCLTKYFNIDVLLNEISKVNSNFKKPIVH